LIEGNLVDVRHKKIFPARVSQKDGVITSVEHVLGKYDGYLIPGLIDSHIHIESSLLCPSRFAEAVVPHGTTAVITDPHEMANVLGVQGIEYMSKDSKTAPLRVYFTAPSCVPATPFETSGAVIGHAEIEQLLAREDFVALGELMNYPGAINQDPEVMAKLEVANKAGKPVDGHAPLLTGAGLVKYVSLGVTTDHECTSSEEAKEKYSLGMKIMVRQGSAAKDLAALSAFAKKHEFLLVSDDKNVSDLMQGHIDRSLAEAVALGIDPIHALKAATFNPAIHYSLPLGAIEPGRKADIVKVSDLTTFNVEEVFINGDLVASGGAAKFEIKPKEMVSQITLQRKVPSDFEIAASSPYVEARIIGVVKDNIVTDSLTAMLRTADGKVMPDLEHDIAKISVVNRYHEAPVANGFVKGFGIKTGAISSSVAHDSHNIIVIGADAEDMAIAANTLITEGGGFCVSVAGKTSMLNLRVAGLMCTKPAPEVKRVLDQLQAKVKELGCSHDNPFMTMSFLSLLVIPKLKLGDKGLFDVGSFQFVDVLTKK